jgi:hypothetical protein
VIKYNRNAVAGALTDFDMNYLKCDKNTTEMLWQVLW